MFGSLQSNAWVYPALEVVHLTGIALLIGNLVLELQSPRVLPADLAQRTLPAQTAPVDGQALLARAQLPRRQDRRWEIELAPPDPHAGLERDTAQGR